jgi:hypothetical protein
MSAKALDWIFPIVGIATTAEHILNPKTSASTINPNPTASPLQTVDPSTSSNVNNLGRAALIATSPQGVVGSDPTNKYALLGN